MTHGAYMDSPEQYLVCAFIATVMAGTSVANSVQRISFAASGWISLRLLYEVATAAVALVVLNAHFGDVEWFKVADLWVPPFFAVFTGNALVRSQFAILGKGQKWSYLGPAEKYAQLRTQIDSKIDDISAVKETKWIVNEVLPVVREVSVTDLAERVRVYVGNLKRLSEEDREKTLQYLQEVEADDDVDGDKKRKQLVQHVLDKGGKRLIEELVREVRQRERTRKVVAY